MYSCPACGSEDAAGRATCSCGADLSLLQKLDSLADAWFNQALVSLQADAPGRALEWLSACCVARPTDAAALRALARVWAQLRRPAEAEAALERAAAIEPQDPDAALIRQALVDVSSPPQPQPAEAQAAAASAGAPVSKHGRSRRKQRSRKRSRRR